MAGINNFPGALPDIVRGNYHVLHVTVTEEAQPVDLSDAYFTLTFDVNIDDTTAPVLVVTASGVSANDPASGEIDIEVLSTDTIQLPVGPVYYSLRLKNTGMPGYTWVLDMGRITVLENVSNEV